MLSQPQQCNRCSPTKVATKDPERCVPGREKKLYDATPYKSELECYSKLLKEKTLPPSRFSRMILDYIQDNPLDVFGRRARFSAVTWLEEEIHSTELKQGFRAVWMHRSKFIRWVLKDTEGEVDEEGAMTWWLKRKAEVPLKFHKMTRPSKEPLKLQIIKEEYADGLAPRE